MEKFLKTLPNSCYLIVEFLLKSEKTLEVEKFQKFAYYLVKDSGINPRQFKVFLARNPNDSPYRKSLHEITINEDIFGLDLDLSKFTKNQTVPPYQS